MPSFVILKTQCSHAKIIISGRIPVFGSSSPLIVVIPTTLPASAGMFGRFRWGRLGCCRVRVVSFFIILSMSLKIKNQFRLLGSFFPHFLLNSSTLAGEIQSYLLGIVILFHLLT